MAMKKPVVLVVLDGWGHREDPKDNAIAAAQTPIFDYLWKEFPHALLQASGEAVGLPDGQMGNSEIGHTTIGAGKIIDTDLVRIAKAIKNDELAANPALVQLFDHVVKNNSTLHIQGLLGEGGVHSHSEHLFAVLKTAKNRGVKKVAIHVFTDGRDTAPQSAAKYLENLQKVLKEVGLGFIATVSGRFYAMDRDNNWDRLAKVEQAMFECKGNVCELKEPSRFLQNLYEKDNQLDEHLPPIVCLDDQGQACAIQNNDAVFIFNFRPDRARMLTKKLLEKKDGMNLCVGTMTDYGEMFAQCAIAFPPAKIETTLAKEISSVGLTQAHIAETEKFPHATYFLNGGVEHPYPGEQHILLDSRKDVPTHDLAPKMRAEAITDKAIEQVNAGTDFIFINYANPDMVGHTANVPAIVEAVEEVDRQLGRLFDAVAAKGGVLFITADHGNAEVNIDQETGVKHTAHTTNPVPAILTDKARSLNIGGLADIAPTILCLLGVPQPAAMTGKCLV